jgi:hypothetical protein
MAVTIGEMQVDVEKQPPATAAPDKKQPKEKLNLREEIKIRAERELRLQAD